MTEDEIKRTVILDFDGVIHAFTSDWVSPAVIVDGPVPGVKEAIDELRKKYSIEIYSSRCSCEEGYRAIYHWLKEHNIKYDRLCKHKPVGFCYVDDRGLKFNGNWTETIKEIYNYKSYLEG